MEDEGMHDRKRLVVYGICWLVACLLTACTRTKELVVILPEEQGKVGEVAIGEGERAVVLDTPYAAAKIDTQGRIKQAVVTPEEVAQTFAHALVAQPPPSLRFVLYFTEGTTEVVSESQTILIALLAEVAKRQAVEVQVTGHTDRVGSVATNDRLALDRAQAVRDMLLQRGLHASFIRAVGRGEREPLVPTPDEQPEPRNRRVEVIVR
jgi:outer membrane protein OmpA-like peptidoglycan-associated protein